MKSGWYLSPDIKILFNIIGSLPPTRASFDECVDYVSDAMDAEELRTALNNVASSSKQTTVLSGWSSSEDEADPMEQEDEGFYTFIVAFQVNHLL